VDPEYVMWAGMPLLPDEALKRYDVDAVLTFDELKSGKSLVQMLKQQQTVVMAIQDRADMAIFHSESLMKYDPLINFDFARRGIEACRVVKDEHEIAMIKYANVVSSYAHERILACAKRAKNERELNAVFVMHCHANGCKEQAYGCICASGTNASTLHWVRNDTPLEGRLNLLIDAGAEYECYCADITRTFPLNGKWTTESKQIYDLVLLMQSECMKMIKAGVLWEDVHMKAHTVAAAGLQSLGILRKDVTLDKIVESKVTCRFFPHGLGHYLGMDTHDVGGNANYEDEDEYFRYLRVRGTVPAGAVITNEPGVYFRKYPFQAELSEGKWDLVVDHKVLEKYWEVGGVRIEDDILVKEGGYENLTTVRSAPEYIESAVSAE
jgi:Xaa-Pro dipeptidase